MAGDRRERSKAERQERILASAAALFAERGYDEVTTREVARAAGVGMGTLFRHAGSKPALLVRVMNARLEQGAREAAALLDGGAGIGRVVAAIVQPLAAEGARHPENLRAYQQATLFGAEPARELAVGRLVELEHTVAGLLGVRARSVGVRAGADLDEVARLVNAVVSMELVRAGAGHEPFDEVAPRVERAVELLVVGLADPPS